MSDARDLAIKQIQLLIDHYDIEDTELYDPGDDIITEDILDGDDFLAYKVSNVNPNTSNAVFLLRRQTAVIDGATLPTMQGWVQVKKGYNPNNYDFSIVATRKDL